MHSVVQPSVPSYQPAIKSIEYTVPSATTPGVTYIVSVNPLTMRPQSCTCKARRECWHRKHIAAGASGLKPRVRFGPVERPASSVSDPAAVLAAEASRRASYRAQGARAVAPASDLYGD